MKMIIKNKNRVKKLEEGGEGHGLYIAQTGATKTFAIERQVEEAFLNGKTIIHLSNAKNNLEQGFCIFKPESKYHLDKLKFQEENLRTHPMIRYIPYSSNIPYKHIYNSEIFSLNIKNLDRVNISFLFESSTETSSISILNQTINSLKNNEGIFDLIYKLKTGKLKQKQDIFSLETGASKINLQAIMNYFGRFRNNPILMPADFKYNLDMSKILNNNKSYHIFDLQFVPDQKIKDLIQLYILNEILKAKSSGKIKKEVIIVIDEIKILCNANPLFDHQKVLNKLIANILSISRSLGIKIISASQTYLDIDPQVRNSFSNVILGRTSAFSDIFTLSQMTGLRIEDKKLIFSLEYNQFMLLSQENDEMSIWVWHAPRHKHCERGENFETFVKKYHPDKLKQHKDIIKEFKEDYKSQESKVRRIMEKHNSKNSK